MEQNKKDPLGMCEVLIKNPANRKRYMAKCIVVDTDWTPLFCYKTSVTMKIITINERNIENVYNVNTSDCARTIAEYKDVFESTLGQLPGVLILKSMNLFHQLCPHIESSTFYSQDKT